MECALGLPVPETESVNELENIERAVKKILAKHAQAKEPKLSRRDKTLLNRAGILSNKDLSLRREYGLSRRQLADALDNKGFNARFLVTDIEFGHTDPKFKKWLREIQNGMGKTRYKIIVKTKDTIWAANRAKVLIRPGTIEQWRSMLPLKWFTCVTETTPTPTSPWPR
jgi:hypothetical protein